MKTETKIYSPIFTPNAGAIVPAEKPVALMFDAIPKPVMSEGDHAFLTEALPFIRDALEGARFRRTKLQKRSIISDATCPNAHMKLHQSWMEITTQFQGLVQESIDYARVLLDLEEAELRVEEATASIARNEKDPFAQRRAGIELRRAQLDVEQRRYFAEFKRLEVRERIEELRDWQLIVSKLVDTLRNEDRLSDEQIKDRNVGEWEGYFFRWLGILPGAANSKDAGEIGNLIMHATDAVKRFTPSDVQKMIPRCTAIQMQGLLMLGAAVQSQNGGPLRVSPEWWKVNAPSVDLSPAKP